jgi:two-component system phosphate regulon sensor histidine kinase PhoR
VLTSQRKLMALLAGLGVLGVLVIGVAAERSLRREQLAQVERSLLERARLVQDQARTLSFDPARMAELDALADRTGRAGEMRVTLIDSAGVVVADSDVPTARLPDIENHARRPEVAAALAGRVGHSTRHSDTTGRNLFYLAIPAPGRGVVRVSVPLDRLEAAVVKLRWEVASAALGAVLLAVLLSYGITRYALRSIHEVRRAAEAIAQGRLDDRPPLNTGDELGEISSAIRQIAQQLRLRLEEVTHEKEQLGAVLEGMVEGVLVVDAKGTVLLANSRLREFFGVTGDLVGRPVLEGIRHSALDEVLREVTASNDRVTRTVSPGGTSQRTLRVQAARFPPGGGPRTGTVLVFHDITELERLESVRRDFVANASHELRTPLTAIHGFAETLLSSEGEDLPPEDRRSFLEVIDRHARRLGHIVNDLLELSTIETGKLRMEPTTLDVAEIVRSVMRDIQPRCAERGLDVSCRVEGDPRAWADPRALEQIVTNLLDNAVKYTEPGGSVEVAVDGTGRRVRVAVRDTGIGIPEDDLVRIFERFYRVDRARSRALGGTGLGLSIVKHLVQSMGGEISVESRLGEGTRFSFSLPRQPGAGGGDPARER